MGRRTGLLLTVVGATLVLAIAGYVWRKVSGPAVAVAAGSPAAGGGAGVPAANAGGTSSAPAADARDPVQLPDPSGESGDADAAQAEVFRRSMAAYATLTSYADTGSVTVEYPGGTEHSVFKTYLRRTDTLDFYLDYVYQYQADPKGDRLNFPNSRRVWWLRNHTLETYDFESRDHRTYPSTSNQAAALNEPRTKGASLLITELLFRKSNLPGTLLQIEESSDAGMEDVDGHACHKVIGIAAGYYPSGQRTNVRQVTIWIDRETLLVRKVFEDTPKGYPADSFNRLIFRIEPQANPTIDDSKFAFQVPEGQD